jgi:hypothetical protein
VGVGGDDDVVIGFGKHGIRHPGMVPGSSGRGQNRGVASVEFTCSGSGCGVVGGGESGGLHDGDRVTVPALDAGGEALDPLACGRLMEHREDGVHEGAQAGTDGLSCEPDRDPHVLEVALASAVRVMGERVRDSHVVTLRDAVCTFCADFRSIDALCERIIYKHDIQGEIR